MFVRSFWIWDINYYNALYFPFKSENFFALEPNSIRKCIASSKACFPIHHQKFLDPTLVFFTWHVNNKAKTAWMKFITSFLGYNKFTLMSSLTLITQGFYLFIWIRMINGRRGIFSLSSPNRDPSHRVGPCAVPEIHLTGRVHGLFQRSISQGGSMGCSRDPSHRAGPCAVPEIHLTGWDHRIL